MAELGSMFAVPLAQAVHPDHLVLNADLRSLLMARSEPRHGNAKPSLGNPPAH